jgi:hypothetical protein
VILTIAELLELLNFDKNAGATGTDPKLKSAKVMLYTNNFSPSASTVIADLTEATFTGYARSAVVTWANAVLSNETSLPALLGDAKTFTVTAQTTPPETVFGYALVATISAVDYLLGVKPAPTPISPVAGTEIVVQPRFGLDDETEDPSGDITFI